MSKTWLKCLGLAILIPLALLVGWIFTPGPKDPEIHIIKVEVTPTEADGGTILDITTKYENSGCYQVLLARFLMSTRPAPSVALPQQQGLTVLPFDKNVIREKVVLGFSLRPGSWHMFSVATCFLKGASVPLAVVSPTALFDVERVLDSSGR